MLVLGFLELPFGAFDIDFHLAELEAAFVEERALRVVQAAPLDADFGEEALPFGDAVAAVGACELGLALLDEERVGLPGVGEGAAVDGTGVGEFVPTRDVIGFGFGAGEGAALGCGEGDAFGELLGGAFGAGFVVEGEEFFAVVGGEFGHGLLKCKRPRL